MGERANQVGMSKLIIYVFYKVYFWSIYLIKFENKVPMYENKYIYFFNLPL